MITLPASFVSSFLGMNLSLKGQELGLTLVYGFIGLSISISIVTANLWSLRLGIRSFARELFRYVTFLDRCSVQAIGSGI